jgi:hypothetical protein
MLLFIIVYNIIYRIDQGSRLLVFPGIATTMDVENDMEVETIAEKILNLSSNIVSYRYKFNPGDSVKIRITDPFVSTMVSQKSMIQL